MSTYHWLAEMPSIAETTIFDIMLTDDELADREAWICNLIDRPEDEEFELDLDNWESNR